MSMMENERLLSDYKRALSHQYDVNSRIAQRLKEEVSDIKVCKLVIFTSSQR